MNDTKRLDNAEMAELEKEVIAALRLVYDPEIPVNIYDLGLIYKITIDPILFNVDLEMTLTSPNCPEAQSLPGLVEATVRSVERINEVHVQLVWDPPWTKENMSEETRLMLGMF